MNEALGFSSVAMIGLGYIGLHTAAMFATRRIEVIGVDVNQHAVAPWFIVDKSLDDARPNLTTPEVSDGKPGRVRAAFHIAAALARRTRAQLRIVESDVTQQPRSLANGQLMSLSSALDGAEVAVVPIAHREFEGLASKMNPTQTVIDAADALS